MYDTCGKQVGYSLPGALGGGEDFFDMDGNPVGQTFDDQYGGEDFIGVDNNSYGYMDQEIIMGRNVWVHGVPFEQKQELEFSEQGDFDSDLDDFDGGDAI